MGKLHKPKSGSMAYSPRVRAKSIVPKFNAYGLEKLNIDVCKPLCFYGIKAGMTHIIAKNAREKTSNYGQEMAIATTVIETPELKVIGGRFYKHDNIKDGKKAIFEFQNQDKDVKKRILGKKQKNIKTLNDILKEKDKANSLTLICSVLVGKTGIGQKKPIIVEIPLSGTYEQQIEYLQSKINKTISIDEVFEKDIYLDIKSITKGKGTQGPVKRFGIKVQRPKAQQIQRHVGSIGPWHPAIVMHNIPRAGQHGFHNRTTYNKKLLVISDDLKTINIKSGYPNYGVVKNKYIVVAGSVPGPSKRVVALRNGLHNIKSLLDVTDIQFLKE